MQIAVGLVFAIPLNENLFGFGQLIAYQEPIYYMVGYDLQLTTPEVSQEKLKSAVPVLMGNFFDILIRRKRWLALEKFDCPKVPFPCYQIRIGDKFFVESWDRQRRREASPEELAMLQPRTNYGPIFLEDALKAHFGLMAWDRAFEDLKFETVAKSSMLC